MSITRKEFFRQGFLSLGKTALELAGTLKGEAGHSSPKLSVERDSMPVPNADSVAVPDNSRCLARGCGCFACVEHCETQAILVVPGEGIRIDQARCTGCGTCEYVCPVVPRAVRLAPRRNEVKNQAATDTTWRKGD